jgi:hypothetical protein
VVSSSMGGVGSSGVDSGGGSQPRAPAPPPAWSGRHPRA